MKAKARSHEMFSLNHRIIESGEDLNRFLESRRFSRTEELRRFATQIRDGMPGRVLGEYSCVDPILKLANDALYHLDSVKICKDNGEIESAIEHAMFVGSIGTKLALHTAINPRLVAPALHGAKGGEANAIPAEEKSKFEAYWLKHRDKCTNNQISVSYISECKEQRRKKGNRHPSKSTLNELGRKFESKHGR